MRRRRALAIVLGLLTTAAVGFPVLRKARSRRLARIGEQAGADSTSLDPRVFAPVAAFAGALFGHRLNPDEVLEVEQGLAFMVQSQGGRRPELTILADYLEQEARAHGAASFAVAADSVRNQMVDRIMRAQVASPRSLLLALVSSQERSRRLIRSEMVPGLAQLYRGSGPAWRRRGYARWPGVPGDPREYTRPGPLPQC